MKPHPRIRKTIKWGGAAVTVLLVVVWVGSGWRREPWRVESRLGDVEISRGRAVARRWSGLIDFPTDWPVGVWQRGPLELPKFKLDWSVSIKCGASGTEIAIPLWILFLLMGTCAAAAWHLDTLARRRAFLNLCPNCNYDRTGLAKTMVSPECGAAPSAIS